MWLFHVVSLLPHDVSTGFLEKQAKAATLLLIRPRKSCGKPHPDSRGRNIDPTSPWGRICFALTRVCGVGHWLWPFFGKYNRPHLLTTSINWQSSKHILAV